MCKCKELIVATKDKVCDKGFLWNPCNYECEYDKSCDAGEYLDYSNCKSRKKLFDTLAEEWTESIEETSLVENLRLKINTNVFFAQCIGCYF